MATRADRRAEEASARAAAEPGLVLAFLFALAAFSERRAALDAGVIGPNHPSLDPTACREGAAACADHIGACLVASRASSRRWRQPLLTPSRRRCPRWSPMLPTPRRASRRGKGVQPPPAAAASRQVE
jgi:hypothetical protein